MKFILLLIIFTIIVFVTADDVGSGDETTEEAPLNDAASNKDHAAPRHSSKNFDEEREARLL